MALGRVRKFHPSQPMTAIENEVSVEANAGFIGVKPELKPSVSVEANAGFIGVKPELKPSVSVEANAGFIGVKPELKPPVSVEANAGFIGVKCSGRNEKSALAARREVLPPNAPAANLNPLWVRGGFPLSWLADDDSSSLRWREAFMKQLHSRHNAVALQS